MDRTQADSEYRKLTNKIAITYLAIWGAGSLGLLLFHGIALRLLRKIDHSATHDHLTQLYNRGTIEQKLYYGLKIADRYEQPFSIMLLDLDHFKQVNDTYGHHTGDMALRLLAETLKANIRETDIVGRFGGEEFLILAPNTAEKAAEVLAKRILEAIHNVRISVNRDTILEITSSIGVASRNEEMDNVTLLLQQADRALYKAKHYGRDQVYVAGKQT